MFRRSELDGELHHQVVDLFPLKAAHRSHATKVPGVILMFCVSRPRFMKQNFRRSIRTTNTLCRRIGG